MATLNQSPVSPKVFTPQSTDAGLSSRTAGDAAWHRTALIVAAWVEIIVGVSLILVPNVQSQFLFGATPDEIGVHVARFAGIALIGLGFACLPSNLTATIRSAARSLLLFNITATILFGWIALGTAFRGVILWPVVILHAVLSIVLALSLKQFRIGVHSDQTVIREQRLKPAKQAKE